MNQTKTTQFTLAPKQALRLFRVSSDLADTMEEILESQGSFSNQFVKGLHHSLRQVKSGKLKKIQSL